MTRWQQWRKAILGTIGAAGIWLAAILAHQPGVMPPPLPIASCGVNQWVLTNDYTTTISNLTITIKSGFETDLASIPPPLQMPIGMSPDNPSIRRGALIHDALYAAELVDRQTADSILYAACIQDGTDPDKARAIWQAVHEWGFVVWDKHTTDSVSQARRLVTVSAR